ncbi:Two component regulator propeller [Tenacibaculum sp. 190524A02b]|uniref:ligand-binding sensor domain-containing protein n=1 Tax=Tenacibaculum vairaonense TaxID=3137860 RepID=UPI0032B14935
MQYKLSFLLSFVAVCCIGSIFGQELIYKHYTIKNGLPHDITYQLIQDSKGYIWIGTDDGLAKFNGTEFTNYSYEDGLTSNYVIDVIEGKHQEKYIATWGGGLHKLQNNKISQLREAANTTYTKTNKIDFIAKGQVYLNDDRVNFKIFNPKTNAYKVVEVIKDEFGNKEVTFNKVNSEGVKYNTSETVVDSVVYIHNNPVARLLDIDFKGVYAFKNSKLITISKQIEDKKIDAITKVKDTFLVASDDNIYKVFNGEIIDKSNISILKEKQVLDLRYINNTLYFISIDKNAKRELYSYKYNNEVINISKRLGIRSLISDFLISKEGDLWITTYGGGLYQIPNVPFKFYGSAFFEETDFKDIHFYKNKEYLLSTNTIYQLHKGKVEKRAELDFHEEKMYLNKNKFEILTLKRATHWVNHQLDIPVEAARYLLRKVNTSIQIDTNFIFINQKRIKRKKTPITKYFLKDSVFYLAYARGGFCKFSAKTGKLLKFWGQNTKIETNRISDFEVVKDTVWLATNKGLFKLVNDQFKEQYTTKNGLLSNHINSICLNTTDNSLWMGTQKGLNVKCRENIYVLNDEVGQESSFITRVKKHNGFIYALGNNGVFTYKLDKKIPVNKTRLQVTKEGSVFSIDAINYTNPKSIQLAYKLNNDDWMVTKNTIVNFSSLSGGTHIVQFKYKDNLSNWKYTKDYTFKIHTPWHEQTWFYVMVTILILGAVVLLLFWGLRRSIKKNKVLKSNIEEKEKLQKALKEVRKNVARDFHDELGNKLASISITSNLLIDSGYESDKDKHDKKIKQIKKDADYLYQGMRDFVWALDHKNDDVHQLQGYLNDFGESLFENTIIAFYSSHNLTNEKVGLPFYWSKQLVLVFKEAMTNVLKHSKATQVKLNFILDKNTLTIELEDNGVGFAMEELKRVNGIKNMKHRVKTLNQQIKIETEKGVKITFLGNLNEGKNE